MTEQNGNAVSRNDAVRGAAKTGEGYKTVAKKPAGEDLSRWENEGGQPSYSREELRRPKNELLSQLFQGGSATFDQIRERVEFEVRERPLVALGVASALGFIIGGGLRTRTGRKLVKRAVEFGLLSYKPNLL